MRTSEGDAADSRKRWLGPLLVAAVAVTVYLNTLALGFTWDDSSLILQNPRIGNPQRFVRYVLVEQPLWRPLKRISLMADYAIWGPEHPAGFHATNVLFHVAASLALYALALRVAGPQTARIAGILFAAHPIHVEAIANITHRKEPMSLLFLLLALVFYARGRSEEGRGDSPHPRRTPGAALFRLLAPLRRMRPERATSLRRAGFWACSWVFFLASMLSKEVGGIMFPALVVAWEATVERDPWRERFRALGWFLAPTLLVPLLFVVHGDLAILPHRFAAGIVQGITGDPTATYARVPALVLKAFGEYARLLVWPSPLYLDRAFTSPRGYGEAGVLWGGAALALYLVLLVRVRRSPAASFGLVFYGVNLLPVINVVPLTHWLVAERFLYVPSAGLAIALAAGLVRLMSAESSPGRQGLAAAGAQLLTAFLALSWGALTMRQNLVWRDESTLWRHTLRYNPRSQRALYAVGLAFQQEGKSEEAERYLRRALEVRRGYAQARYALAFFYLDEGRVEEAMEEARRFIRMQPEDADGYVIIGNAELIRGCPVDAVRAYRKAVELEPWRTSYRYNLALALHLAGDDREALAEAEAALVAKGGELDVALLLPALLERVGRVEEALTLLRERADRWNGAPEVVEELVQMLERQGLRAAARAEVARALQRRPARAELQILRELLECDREEQLAGRAAAGLTSR